MFIADEHAARCGIEAHGSDGRRKQKRIAGPKGVQAPTDATAKLHCNDVGCNGGAGIHAEPVHKERVRQKGEGRGKDLCGEKRNGHFISDIVCFFLLLGSHAPSGDVDALQ